ncbi:hypothetical protein KA005_50640, partial [bacterium]|nr:hypothetical protein [bacterium]
MRKFLIVAWSVVVLVLLLSFVTQAASVTVEAYPLNVAKDGTQSSGTPFGIFVVVSEWTSHANDTVCVRVHSGSYTNYWHWSAKGTWSRTAAYDSSNYPILKLDASGNGKKWIFLKYQNDKVFNTLDVRIRDL